jgi:hypothetical protein
VVSFCPLGLDFQVKMTCVGVVERAGFAVFEATVVRAAEPLAAVLPLRRIPLCPRLPCATEAA